MCNGLRSFVKLHDDFVCSFIFVDTFGKGGMSITAICLNSRSGVVHKLRLQEEVGRWSKNVKFYKVEIVNEGGYVVKNL